MGHRILPSFCKKWCVDGAKYLDVEMLKGLNRSSAVEKYVLAYIVKANLMICLSPAVKR